MPSPLLPRTTSNNAVNYTPTTRDHCPSYANQLFKKSIINHAVNIKSLTKAKVAKLVKLRGRSRYNGESRYQPL